MSEYGIIAYDLEPPSPLPPLPAYSPLRHPGQPSPRPRYAPPPLPDGFARVELDEDYYAGPGWSDWTADTAERPSDIFDIPAEQRDRWAKAMADYQAMQDEISALRDERHQPAGHRGPAARAAARLGT